MIYHYSDQDPRFESFRMVQSGPFYRALGLCLAAAAVFGIVALIFVPWQQTAMGTGRVIAYSPTERQQTIDAPVDGRLARWFVHEGSEVKQGDPIVELVDNDPDILNRLMLEKQALENRLAAVRVSAVTAKINIERQKILEEKGLSSRRSYELAKMEHAKYLAEEANAQAELARISVRLSRQHSQSVKAPRDGTILRRLPGESSVMVKAGESLATIVPLTSSRAVELWVDGNDIALLSIGRQVRLQFEGWPAIQFSGWPSVAVGTFAGKISIIDAADNGHGKFRILVIPDGTEPWPSSQYLRQGIRAHGWVILNQVKLGYEAWRKFNGFPPVVSPPPDSEKHAH